VRQFPHAARIAGICGLAAFVTFNIGWIAGGLAQPSAYSFANDTISDVGAVTADSSWIHNQIGSNLTGLLVVVLALGLWRALSPDLLGRLGAGALLVTGAGLVLDGFFQLDCRGIDTGCTNDSWHSHAHKINSGIIIGVAAFAAPVILAFAFRRIPAWRDSWLPSLVTVPAILLASLVFSAVGGLASERQTSSSSSGSPSSACACFRRGTARRRAEPRPGRECGSVCVDGVVPPSVSSRPTSF
jgi:hypothetical protein